MNTVTDTSEADLLAQFVRNGCDHAAGREALDGLVRLYIDYVYGIARRATRNEVLAEDVTQAVFLILARKAPSIRHAAQLPAWLFKTTRYAAANALKMAARRAYHERHAARPEELSMSADDPSVSLVGPHVYLEDALARLSQRERHIILLRYFRGQEYADIAAALGISQDAARKRLSRGIERMREILSRGATSPVDASAITAGLTAAAGQRASTTFAAAVHNSVLSNTVAPTVVTLSKGTLVARALTRAKAKVRELFDESFEDENSGR